MTGSEKQIKWATEIKDRIEKIYSEVLEANKDHKNYTQVKALSENVIANISKAYAGDVIDTFKNVETAKDLAFAVMYSKKFNGINWAE